MNKSVRLLATAVLVACTFPLLAADDQAVATLDIKAGTAAPSTGGEFAATTTGQRLQAGNRVMLMEGDSVRVVYDNDCDVTFKNLGVYTIDPDCTPVAVVPKGNAGMIAGVVAGAVLLGAAAGGGGGDSTPPPPTSR